ncbi:tetratricopeptide repeat-containing glycosyltransferase family 2 protein [Bacillus cereus]|uniref:tetratricopeptide repeat-containing glycosyltransferase family 2 protein n=1 Tax=Bacillus sp. ABP14 TaxID=1892404 RepID=UPI0009F593AA|nr:glycosyltransferase family 2 protein [Bacillus sp. ABP14]
MKKFLSACLIVKNEEDMLRRCLESLQGSVDEIIVVDTGSTDNTKKIAEEFTNKVYDFKWENDFAAARNFATSKASGEWIFAIDADECVEKDNIEEVIKKIKLNGNKYNIYIVEIISFLGRGGQSTTVNKMARIFKNDRTIQFKGPIHEQLVAVSGSQNVAFSTLTLYHYGYLEHVIEKQDKKNRNLEIVKQDLKSGKNKGFSYFNYGQELRRLRKTSEALNNFVKAYAHKESIEEEWVRTCLFFIIECLTELKRYEEALKIIKDTETLWPSAPDFTFAKGDIYFLQKRFDDAKEIYQDILANSDSYNNIVYHHDRKSFLPYERLGRIYQIEKNVEAALQAYIKALNENSTSIHIIIKIVEILSEYNEAQEVYDFLNNHNIIKADAIRLEIIKCLLGIGYADLAVKLAGELEKGNENLIRVINLKATMIQYPFRDNISLIFEEKDILLGIEIGMFDLADLCILYDLTQNQFIEIMLTESKFKHVFEGLFTELNHSTKIKSEEYLSILKRALCYKHIDFVEKLIVLKKLVPKDINAKIADLFYENGYEDIAMDFYEISDDNHVTKQGYANVIEYLLEIGNKEEAHRISVEALNKFKKDFRFYKYSLETSEEDAEDLMSKAVKLFPDSNWLKRILLLTF